LGDGKTGESMSIDKAAAFAGSLAEYYDRYLVPLNFAPHA